MRAVLVHSLPGRARFRVMPGALFERDTAGIANALTGIPGVRSAGLNGRTGSILVFYDANAVSEAAIGDALGQALEQALGQAEPPVSAGGKPARGRSRSDPSGLAWSYIGYQLFRLFCPPAFKPLVTVLGAVPLLVKGLKSLAQGRLDVPALDAAAVGASLAQGAATGRFNAASTLIMLLKTGEYLEAWAKQRSRENLSAALALNYRVGQVWVRDAGGAEQQKPYAELRRGDRIVLRSGGLIPVDGRVIEGRALVNEAALTGEPLAIEKTAGQGIHAGTVIEEGELVAEVWNMGGNTRYEQIIALIEEGEGAKADTELRANRIAHRAVPFTFAAAALTLLISRNPWKAASVLSVDYSCAIKLSTPLAFLAAIREGLRNGVFFKGGSPLEKFAACDTIVFDKTGTLTLAAPALERIIPYNGFTEREALKIAACLEEHFPHPVARAVVTEALAKKVRHKEEHSTVKYIAAHGIATEYRQQGGPGKHTVIGSRHFIGDDEGIDLSAAWKDAEAAAREGCTVLYLAQEKKLAAILLIKDPLREEAPEVIAMLRALGIRRFYLFSGDNKNAAERIARGLSFDGGRGELLPQDKTALVKVLREKGCRVAFVGDGMNDSPAMSAAQVGIAMKDGADLARETADITLRESSLYPLVIARLISDRVMKRIAANTGAAIVLNSIFILLGLLETPVSGFPGSSRSVWLHNLTTLGLSMNAMRPVLTETN